jgi:hypothetical protein
MSTNAPETLMTRSLLDVFNQWDPQQRAAAIEEIYSPDIVFHEQDGTVTGAAAMQERVQRLLTAHPASCSHQPVSRPSTTTWAGCRGRSGHPTAPRRLRDRHRTDGRRPHSGAVRVCRTAVVLKPTEIQESHGRRRLATPANR